MKRREFIAGLAGAAAWPLAARAQQAERIRRVGVLMLTSSHEPESQTNIAAFLQGLQEAGWAVGRNLRIDYRWSEFGVPHRGRLQSCVRPVDAAQTDCWP